MKNNTSNLADDLQLYITVTLASKYSNIPVKSLVGHIQNGFIPHRGAEYPESATPEEITALSNKIEIPLSELAPEDIKSYILDCVGDDKYFNPDLLGYEQKFGRENLNYLLEDINILKDIATYRQTHFSASMDSLCDSILKKYNLSSTRYYEELNDLKKNSYYRGLFKKQLKLDKKNNFTSLCPLACDFIMNRLFRYNNSEPENILADLTKEAECQGSQICFNCPHNPSCSCYETSLEEVKNKYPTQTLKICELAGNGLIIPSSHATIKRFIGSISSSMLYFAQNDYKLWEARYGYKISRKLPSKVNEIACGDHTELDIALLYGYTPEGEPIIKRPWATIQLDIASGIITGSVLSFRPDNETIGQCFARASAITVNNPEIYGVPKVLLVDRGRDYRSRYVCSNNPNYPNRAIFENGLMPVLGCRVMHCGPKSPWVKPIERTNLTIKKMLRRYPGYTGGKRRKRFKYRSEEEFKRLLKDGRIMTLEQFAMYWYNEIIPAFNNHAVRGKPSPMERYRSLPNEETLVPEWSTLSVFLKKKHTATVNSCKIRFGKHKYYSKLLDEYNDKKVLIYTLDENYTDSIFVVCGHNFVCEAFRENKIDFVEKDPYKLQKALSNLCLQKRNISQGIEVIRFLAEVAKLNHNHYIDEDIIYTVGEAMAPGGTPISDGSLAAAKAEHEAKIREIDKYMKEKKQLMARLIGILCNSTPA